jgi:hypothetical protein
VQSTQHRRSRLSRRELAIYTIVNIGASFSNKDRKRLEETINEYVKSGWRFHSVFTVESRGCLGFFRETTNFMVMEAVKGGGVVPGVQPGATTSPQAPAGSGG